MAMILFSKTNILNDSSEMHHYLNAVRGKKFFNFLISFSCVFTMPKILKFSLSLYSASASNFLASVMTEDFGVTTELLVAFGSTGSNLCKDHN
jgi:hypothetical protein